MQLNQQLMLIKTDLKKETKEITQLIILKLKPITTNQKRTN